jgi:N-acetylglucosaminyldiphosphoundecaprenol N-acetyl-beta-D-mannosaminyltransferase
MIDPAPVVWPTRHEIFGTRVSATNYREVVDAVLKAAKAGQPAMVDFISAHGLTTAARDPAYRRRLNDFDILAPDGQPVRWALNHFHEAGLADRVYGPELMRRLCKSAADCGIPIYLYGSSQNVVEALSHQLLEWFPELIIAGAESPPFRPLTADEDAEAVDRINRSGAKLLFIGISSPKQEIFAHEHRKRIRPVQLCVGAAFDFHAGTKKMAPRWMQRRGMEWLFRLTQEPGRLWKRYLVVNTTYLLLFAREATRRRLRGTFARVGFWNRSPAPAVTQSGT